MADSSARDPRVRGVLGLPFAQQIAFFRGKLGNLVPTETWRDVLRGQHDRAFMVAGAQNADLLAGLAASIDRSQSQGGTLEEFRRDFRQLVEDSGWNFTGQFNQRTRTIYGTNMRTSYAAGRAAQLRAGGFAFLLYKHGGSADPRPQHLAWDGLVLPADHPFWQTHTPPNGWGCSCRVVGLRRPEDARRLGGDPDKALPYGWDDVSLLTGAPVGIDEGWDYAPGASVTDLVQTMAEKTQQWDYTLAKAYMQGVPDAVRDQLAEAYRRLPSVANAARLYAQRVLEGVSTEAIAPYLTFGLAPAAQITRIRRLTAIDATGFDFAMDVATVGHVRRTHGNAATEAARGQRAVTAADYSQLPALINAPDQIDAAGTSDTGRNVVTYTKRFGSETWVAAFEIRGKRRSLALQTLSIRVKGRP